MRYQFAPYEAPIADSLGESLYAVRAPKMHSGKPRPAGWIDEEYGLVVHTTGSGLPERAHKNGIYPTVIAADYYFKQNGPHYVCGWQGHAGGDLLQIANEREQANGVGTIESRKDGKLVKKGQRQSEQGKYKGSWKADLPAALVRRWEARWPGYASPLKLIPGRTVNSAYIQCEMIPCVFWVGRKKIIAAPPLRDGLKFTAAQHNTIAFLACDIARRKGWPDGWWETPRFLGHEDVTPISRHDRNGGWDPGGLRAKPYFDWEYVYEMIRDILNVEAT